MIRGPRPTDKDRMTELVGSVYGEFMQDSGMPLVAKDLANTVDVFIKTKCCLLVERDGIVVGIAAWQLSPHPGNYSCVVFQEILWCLKSSNIMDASILLKAIERKAIELKANILILGNLSIENEEQLRRIYGKLGFKFIESHYSKTLGGQ